ncbi:MAG TPA: hypothetical protein VF221_12510 [Chloroflexota bacterium]
MAENPDLHHLFAAYSHLTVEDVKAVPAYAHDAVSHPHSSGLPWLRELNGYFGRRLKRGGTATTRSMPLLTML